MAYPRGNLFIPGPAGPIECIEWAPAAGARWAVASGQRLKTAWRLMFYSVLQPHG